MKFKILLLLATILLLSCEQNEKINSNSNQELDHKILLDLFSEIETIAYSYTCEDEGEWFFTPYGSKPCGGPMGYIPYSNQIEIPQFLEKVNKYTNAEEVFNIKWGVISTCDIVPEPKGVVCKNRVPSLIY